MKITKKLATKLHEGTRKEGSREAEKREASKHYPSGFLFTKS